MNTPPELLQGIIVWLASIFGALAAIYAGVDNWFLKPRRKARRMEIDSKFKEIVDMIQDFKEEVQKQLTEHADSLNHARVNSKRNEYLLMINNQPTRVDEIERVYQEYRNLGGNGYITMVHRAWEEEYGEKIVRQRIKKGE